MNLTTTNKPYWYSWGYEECFGETPKGFVFIAVEKRATIFSLRL